MTATKTDGDPALSSSAERFNSSIEQLDGIDCPNIKVPWLLGINIEAKKAVIFRPRCKSWACPVCGPKNAFLWSMRASAGAHQLYDAGRKMSFVTITSSNKIEAAKSWWVAPKAWMKLQARMRRTYGLFAYFLVPEVQDRGHVHFHGIFDIGLEKRWLKDNAAGCGFGYMDDAKEVWAEGGVVGYILKYLTKALDVTEMPKGTRHVRTSLNWPKLPSRDPPADWTFQVLERKEPRQRLSSQLESAGFEVHTAGSKTAWKYVSPDD